MNAAESAIAELLPDAFVEENPVDTASNQTSNDIIPEGQRDHTLASLAGTMRHKGFSVEAIAAALQVVNGNRADLHTLAVTSSGSRTASGGISRRLARFRLRRPRGRNEGAEDVEHDGCRGVHCIGDPVPGACSGRRSWPRADVRRRGRGVQCAPSSACDRRGARCRAGRLADPCVRSSAASE